MSEKKNKKKNINLLNEVETGLFWPISMLQDFVLDDRSGSYVFDLTTED